MPKGGIKIAKIFGIEIIIDYSWFIIFFLISWSLSFGYFPAIYKEIEFPTNVFLGLFTSVLFFASALIHELSHSIVAKRGGIQIKRITLFIFGGVAHLSDEPKTALAELKMASAGPFSSLFLAASFFVLDYFAVLFGATLNVTSVLETLAFLNFMLAFFNLLPGFPLDGGRIFRAAVWMFTHSLKRATFYASLGGKFIASSLILLGFLEIVLVRSLAGVWLILIGFFLYQAAEISYRQTVIRGLMSNVEVKDLMAQERIFIPLHLKLSELSDRFLRYRKRNFLVVSDHKIVGVVNLENLKEAKDKDLEVKDIMIKINRKNYLDPRDSVLKALEMMNENNVTRLPVLKQDKFLGVINLGDIDQYLKIKSDLLAGRKKA